MKATARIVLAVFALLTLLPPSLHALTPSADLLRCQKRIGLKGRAFAKFAAKKIHKCTEKVAVCKLANEIDAADLMACMATTAATCNAVDAAIDAKRVSYKASVDKVCGGLIPLADLEPYIGSMGYVNVATACTAANTTALTDCLLDGARCSGEREVFRRDPRAVDSLTSAGIAANFPCVGP